MKTRNKDDVEMPANYAQPRRSGSGFSSFLAGATTVFLLLLCGAGGWLYLAIESGQVSNPFNRQTNTKNTANFPPPTTKTTSQAPGATVGTQTNKSVQPAFGNKAGVELVSVKRVSGKQDEVSVEMRINRIADNSVVESDAIDTGATTARNPITNEIYAAVDPVTRSSGSISLYNASIGQPVNGSVVLRVPEGVKAIDILVQNTEAFRNVAIAPADAATDAQKSSSVNPGPAPNATVNPSAPATTTTVTQSSGTSAPATPAPNTTVNSGTPATQKTAPVPSTTKQTAPQPKVEIKPGEFVQLAFGAKAEVELLSVKRVEDPTTGNRDVVNVQMRIRRMADDVGGKEMINVGKTTARDRATTETYKAVDPSDRATGTVSLFNIPTNGSADAYVWLRVPEGVNTLEIYVPQTAAFKNVPISN